MAKRPFRSRPNSVVARLVVDPEAAAGQQATPRSICFRRHSEVEMSNAELSDHQLLDKAKAALSVKDGDLAKVLFAEFSDRSVARNKAKVANDPG